jgi:hypothetical protein
MNKVGTFHSDCDMNALAAAMSDKPSAGDDLSSSERSDSRSRELWRTWKEMDVTMNVKLATLAEIPWANKPSYFS